ncbi:hypothetical protein R7O13_27810, partial [Vibrio sp. Y176]|uniref:hypothetical protein n=1 Tax=Vibrio sp. Y176 TaxID=3074704 RepID=UPI00296593B3
MNIKGNFADIEPAVWHRSVCRGMVFGFATVPLPAPGPPPPHGQGSPVEVKQRSSAHNVMTH